MSRNVANFKSTANTVNDKDPNPTVETRDPKVWGPHLRNDTAITDEQADSLKAALFGLRLLDSIQMLSDLAINWATRYKLSRMRSTAEQFRDMMLENAKTRGRFLAGDLDLKEQHKEARQRWNKFFDEFNFGMLEEESRELRERRQKGSKAALGRHESLALEAGVKSRAATWAARE